MNINAFKPMIENQLTAMLGREVKLGDLSLSVFSGTVDARNLVVADDPHFGSEPFITASIVHIGVQMSLLLLRRQIIIESLEVEAPQIHVVRTVNGAWNFFSLGRKISGSQTQVQNQPVIPAFTVNSIRVKSGYATLENLPGAGAPIQIDHIDLAVDNFSLAKEFAFTLSASLPGQATLNLTGNAGPINLDPAKASFDLKLAGDKLPIAELQSLLPAIGIKLPTGSVIKSGTVTTHLTIVGPLQALVVNGAVEFANLRLSGLKLG